MDFDQRLDRTNFVDRNLASLGQTLIYQHKTPRAQEFLAVLDTVKTVDAGGGLILQVVILLDSIVMTKLGLLSKDLLNKVFYYPHGDKYYKVVEVNNKSPSRLQLTVTEVSNSNTTKNSKVL